MHCIEYVADKETKELLPEVSLKLQLVQGLGCIRQYLYSTIITLID